MVRTKPTPLEEVIYTVPEAVKALAEDTEIGIDTETSGLSPWHDKIAVVSLWGEQSGRTAVLHIRGIMPPALRDFLSRPEPLWIGHNVGQFDALFLAMAGVNVYPDSGGARYFDTLIGEQMTLSSGRRDVRAKLQDAVERRLGVRLAKGMGESTWMADSLTEEQLRYCVEDVFYLPKLRRAQLAKVEGTRQAEAMDFEQRLHPIVSRMSLNGLPLDTPALEAWRARMVVQEIEARQAILATMGDMNPGSSKQVKDSYKRVFDIDLDSTDVEHLTALADVEGIPGSIARSILIARRAKKRTGMYDDQWVTDYSCPRDLRIHARFWQVGTDTFRFSSSAPNLQQIPRDGRHIFGGMRGHRIVSCDFSQLEVRVAAGIAQDEALLAALDTEDIHTTVASSLYGKPVSAISKEERRIAKAAVFTLLFGGSAGGLVRYAKMSGGVLDLDEAKRVVHTFFATYHGISAARQRAIYTSNQGRTVPLTLPNGGRRVLTPELNHYGEMKVRPSQILNTMVQGTAAIGMKAAIFECHERGLSRYLGSVVHDELVACVPTEVAEEYAVSLADCMIVGMNRIMPGVKIGVEWKVCSYWGADRCDSCSAFITVEKRENLCPGCKKPQAALVGP